MKTTNGKENLLWFCTEEVREFGNVTEATLEECKENGITLDEINKAIEHFGVTVSEDIFANKACLLITHKVKVMRNMFSDIDAVWADKRVEFTAGEHKGKVGVCLGFRNAYGGAGLLVLTDCNERIMVYSRDLDNIKKI